MSPYDALKLANVLIMSGEADVSSVFLPVTPMKRGEDGSIINLAGTEKGNEIMNKKSNLIDEIKKQIKYKKSKNQPTELHEKGLVF